MGQKNGIAEEKIAGNGIASDGNGEIEEDSSAESEVDEALEELSPEILELLGGNNRVFESEEDLRKALQEAGVGDLRVVLVDGRPRKIVAGHQHNAFTTKYVSDFFDFRKNVWGKWASCSGTHKINLDTSLIAPGDPSSRDPDLSYWGYPRLDPTCSGPFIEDAIPDVVIQFSWQNKKWYEEKAIDDIMTKGLEQECGSLSATRPRVGYLIKVRFSKKRTLAGAIKGNKTQDMIGLDIYRLSHGTTLANARDPTNHDAEHTQFSADGGQEVLIVIKPEDLGITGFRAMLCGTYTLKASDIFARMEAYHKSRQARGLAT